jgi:hypothetical protein
MKTWRVVLVAVLAISGLVAAAQVDPNVDPSVPLAGDAMISPMPSPPRDGGPGVSRDASAPRPPSSPDAAAPRPGAPSAPGAPTTPPTQPSQPGTPPRP